MDVRCCLCGKAPAQIDEYMDLALDGQYENADEACKAEEGTYNPSNGLFACTSCYIELGMPTGPQGWRPSGMMRRRS